MTTRLPIHPAAAAVLAREQWKQRTPEWYAVRRELITASDAASAISIPPYASYKGDIRADTLIKKLDNLPFNNKFCAHGVKFEDEALSLAMSALGDVGYEVGLLRHPELPWLAASPDGITHSGKCIEIKCPLMRKIIPGVIPHHYYPQVSPRPMGAASALRVVTPIAHGVAGSDPDGGRQSGRNYLY